MAGTNAGTGQPIWFLCPVARRNKWRLGDQYHKATYGHERIARTGRVRKAYYGALGIRMLPESHEYRCECGHVGWSRHRDILRYAVQ